MRFVPRARHRSSRPGVPHHAILFSFVMLVMVLAPLGSRIATAQEGDTAQATEEPPAPDATEEPVESEEHPQSDPTEVPVNELLGAIEIDYWECPDPTTLQEPDFDTLYEACTGVNGIPFSVSASDGANRSQQTGEYGDAHVSFTELPTGITAISGPGGTSVAWCNGIVQHGGPETGYQSFDAGSGTISWNLQDDEIVFCSWLTVPDTASATTGSFEIEYRTCPEGYAFLDATVLSQLEIMLLDCEIENNIEFALDQPGINGNPRVTGNDGDGRVVFTGVPAGLRTLRQTSPWGDANTYVVCEGIQQPGGTSTGPMVMGDANGMIQWDLKAGQVVSCGWFVGDAMMNDSGGGIVIRYHECPQGTDFATLPESDLAGTCTGTVDGVVFRTISGGQYDVSAATGDSGSSEVRFDNVVPGLVYVKQVSPVKQMIVICQSDAAVSTPTRVPVTQAQIEWVLQEGESLTCDWYVIPAPGTITIQTWACGSGADPGMTVDEAVATCGNFPGLVDFTLTNRTHAQTVTTTDHVARFTEVPPGQVVIGMDPGVSVADGIVRCEVRNLATNDVLSPMTEFPVSGATPDPVSLSITLTLGSAQSVACEWYLVPADWTDDGNARLELATYACNGEAIPDDAETYEEFITLCAPESTRPVKFTVTGANEFTKTRTIAGTGIIENIPPGDIVISPTLPDGTASVRVYCSGRGIDAKEYELVWGSYEAGDTGAIDYPIPGDFHISCSWFLISETINHHQGALVVVTHTCVTETFVSDVDCEIEEGGGFDLLHWNGEAWDHADSGTTDGSGILRFTGLDAGEYWLDGDGDDWCWLASAGLSDDGNWLIVQNGEETVVHVYNCGGSRGSQDDIPVKGRNHLP